MPSVNFRKSAKTESFIILAKVKGSKSSSKSITLCTLTCRPVYTDFDITPRHKRKLAAEPKEGNAFRFVTRAPNEPRHHFDDRKIRECQTAENNQPSPRV